MGGFLLAPITSSPEALVLGGAFLVLCSDSAIDQSLIPRSWEGLLPRGLFLVVEDNTICFPLLLGIPAILLPFEFADLVDTGRVLAEAAPFVVVHFVVGSVIFLAVHDVLFGGSSLPSCMPSRTGLRLDTLGIVLHPMLMCLNVSGKGTPLTGVVFWTA
jgi:hypothetical protein